MAQFRRLRALAKGAFRSAPMPQPGPFDLLSSENQAQIQALQHISGGSGLLIHVKEGKKDAQTAVIGALGSENGSLSTSLSLRRADADVLQWLWPIASYSKVFINLLFIRIVTEPGFAPVNLTWKTPVREIPEIIKESRKMASGISQRTESEGSHIREFPEELMLISKIFSPNMELGELLCHHGALPEMNRRLLAPNGQCYVTRDDFLRVAAQISRDEKQNPSKDSGRHEYSNANHIAAAILLGEIFQKNLCDIMHKFIFGPLGMTSTFMGRDPLPEEEKRLVTGFHVRSDKSRRRARSPTYGQSVGKYFLGAFSCVSDLDCFNQHLSAAIRGDPAAILSGTITGQLFGKKLETERYITSLMGEWFELDADITVPRSLNYTLIPSEGLRPLRPCKFPDGSKFQVIRTVGYVDGYSMTAYYYGPTQCYVIVLGNSSGPFEVADHIVYHILQNLYALKPRLDIDVVRKGFLQTAHALKGIEDQDGLLSRENEDFGKISGTYIHERYKEQEQWKIERDGKVYICGTELQSGPFQVTYCAPDKIRMIPGDSNFGIERWSVWRALEFSIKTSSEGQLLLVNTEHDRYTRVSGPT